MGVEMRFESATPTTSVGIHAQAVEPHTRVVTAHHRLREAGMSHTDKDQPWRVTGIWTHRYWITPRGHGAWKRSISRRARSKAANALRNGREPEPRYSIEREYFD